VLELVVSSVGRGVFVVWVLEFEDDEGNTTTFDPGLGLPVDYAYQVISQVGNYGEIFEANLAPLGLERGVNALWIDGGLLYAAPGYK